MCISCDVRTHDRVNEITGWFASGTNHRVVDGHAIRDFVTEQWVVEVDNLADFIRKNGTTIIHSTHVGLTLEIYDDYRE